MSLMVLKTFLVALVSFLFLDSIWLGLMRGTYVRELAVIGRISGGKFQPVYWAAFAAYFLLAIALTCFVLPNILAGDTLTVAFGYGALMGLCLYGVYNATDHAILRDYSVNLAIMDTAWGTFACGVVSVVLKLFRDR